MGSFKIKFFFPHFPSLTLIYIRGQAPNKHLSTEPLPTVGCLGPGTGARWRSKGHGGHHPQGAAVEGGPEGACVEGGGEGGA